ncbi:MAG: B12-binding domain-containing radical SAM protein, partial [Defluviitaleaceae bacterium]|nr:B12-binding domain-containing radical SAM protein [Defluviitaleaceae bacterium]
SENSDTSISLPSLRIDAINFELLDKIQKVRKSGLTFAPEAGSQRLRDAINKNISEDEILNGAKLAFEGGWNRIKLYFMIGLPTEEDDDISAICKLAQDILDQYYTLPKESRKRAPKISVSVSAFVPKPFTPFQWEPQNSLEVFSEKQDLLKHGVGRKRNLDLNYHNADIAILEGVFARGDRRLSAVIVRAWQLGCRFDAWSEHFKHKFWMQAFSECSINSCFYTMRHRNFDEILPWDFIDIGVTKDYLIEECKKAYDMEITPDCRKSCSDCGMVDFGGGNCCG